MEKKTMGQFISALRKANGMTQKQLADKLNVSDKSVSRWERDECAPDLMLIPVIAEIFGITSDEILKGERNNPEKAAPAEDDFTPRAQKQLSRLFEKTKTKFKTQSIIAVGIGFIAPIVGWLFDLGLNKSTTGFFVALAISVAAIMLEIAFAVSAFSKINSDEFEKEFTGKYKKNFLLISEVSLSFIISLFALMIPLIFVVSEAIGILTALVAAIICVLVSWIISAAAVKKDFYYLPEEEKQNTIKLNRLRKKYLIILVAVFAVTLLFGQIPFNATTEWSNFVSGQTFTDTDEFVKFIETPVPYDDFTAEENLAVATGEEASEDSEFENYSGEFEDSIENRAGQTVLKFNQRNQSVIMYTVKWKSDTELESITAYTSSDRWQGYKIIELINAGWCVCLFVEFAIVFAVYKKKKSNL